MFLLGCQDLIIIIDHKPLLSIFNNRDLGTIMNPQILKLKEKTLLYSFTIQYCLGKWPKAADVVSRNPPKPLDHQYPLSENYVPHHPKNPYTKQKKLRQPLTRSVLFRLQPLIALLGKRLPVTNLLQWNP